MSACTPPRMRHWFSRFGFSGDVLEFCARGCGVRNPRWPVDESLLHMFEGPGRRCGAPGCNRGIMAKVHDITFIEAEEGDW